jgi:2-polyprenyl-3-methyl-5-hydroxy-6-metoxy-1,4-benzoquinol methylase
LYPFSNIYLIIFQESILCNTIKIKQIREFWFSDEMPKYSNLRASHFLGYNNKFPPWLSRGFYSRQAIKKGDRVLDIGGGNGFFTCFFLSDICSKIDAIDINHKAIKNSRKYHH